MSTPPVAAAAAAAPTAVTTAGSLNQHTDENLMRGSPLFYTLQTFEDLPLLQLELNINSQRFHVYISLLQPNLKVVS